MAKAVLLGVAQAPKHSVFSLEKKKNSLDAIRGFLHELGFPSWDTARILGPIGGADRPKPTMKFKAALYDDKFFALNKGQYHVEIFFGKKKAVVSVTTTDDLREHLLKNLLLYCEKRDSLL